jgi:histone-lysine N-methyltransferase SETMAR
VLVNELKPVIKLKHQGLLSKRVLFLYDNACAHMAVHIVGTLHALKFEVLKHPLYSLDLAPSDFHLFGPLKEHLWGQNFADCNKVMEAVQSWLKATSKKLCSRGHPQACGQVDQMCCKVRGLCRKIKLFKNSCYLMTFPHTSEM